MRWPAFARRSAVFGRLRGLLRVDSRGLAEASSINRRCSTGRRRSFCWHWETGENARTAFAPPRLPKNNSIELVVTFAYDE